MSAVQDDNDGSPEVVNVLFALYPGVETLDFAGPLSILDAACHNIKDPESKAFDCTFAGTEPAITTRQGLLFKAHISLKEAHERLDEFDVLIVPGGEVEKIVKGHGEPIGLIDAFAELQKGNPSRERTLMSICTGSLLLAKAGVLQGLAATTHPDSYIQLENLCKTAAAGIESEQTDVMEERYVVNNARFDLGNIEENPFVVDKPVSHKDRRRSSVARKGSMSLKRSNTQEEANARRAALRLGGLRVVTSGAVTSGLDASLYLVCALVSEESAQEVARILQYDWVKGVVVNTIDV